MSLCGDGDHALVGTSSIVREEIRWMRILAGSFRMAAGMASGQLCRLSSIRCHPAIFLIGKGYRRAQEALAGAGFSICLVGEQGTRDGMVLRSSEKGRSIAARNVPVVTLASGAGSLVPFGTENGSLALMNPLERRSPVQFQGRRNMPSTPCCGTVFNGLVRGRSKRLDGQW